MLGSLFGEDIALVDTGSSLLASHVDPIVGAAEGLGRLAIHVACNDLAASGVSPRWAQILVLTPVGGEDSLKKVMEEAVAAAKEISVTIIGGHSGYTAALSRPLAAVTAMGVAQDRVIPTGGAKEGDVICITRGVGLEGTAILAWDYREKCRSLGLSDSGHLRGQGPCGRAVGGQRGSETRLPRCDRHARSHQGRGCWRPWRRWPMELISPLG